jgi:hypothetical protein
MEREVVMRRLIVLLAGVPFAFALALAAPTAASASTPMRITVGAPITVANKLLISVPVTVVCDPLPNVPMQDFVSVQVTQARGKSVSHATGFFTSSSQPYLTCDGTTANELTVLAMPDSTSGPFNPGPAVLTAMAFHETATSCGVPGCFTNFQSESASTGPVPVSLHG